MTTTDNKDATVSIDRGYHWQPIDADTPRGRKVQVINRQAGVAASAVLGAHETFWTHWAPFPTFAPEDK